MPMKHMREIATKEVKDEAILVVLGSSGSVGNVDARLHAWQCERACHKRAGFKRSYAD